MNCVWEVQGEVPWEIPWEAPMVIPQCHLVLYTLLYKGEYEATYILVNTDPLLTGEQHKGIHARAYRITICEKICMR